MGVEEEVGTYTCSIVDDERWIWVHVGLGSCECACCAVMVVSQLYRTRKDLNH